jgi:hypothetical protein
MPKTMSTEKPKPFKIKDVPPEVQKVWAVQAFFKNTGIGVGADLYNECQRTINNYPEWFPEPTQQPDDKPTK